MQLSQKPLNKNLKKQLEQMFYQLMVEVQSDQEMRDVLNDLLTDSERMAILKRMGIAIYLDKGRSYEDIKNNIMVSSATIASVAESIGNPGWQEVIKRIKAEEWSTAWTEKILKNIRKVFPR